MEMLLMLTGALFVSLYYLNVLLPPKIWFAPYILMVVLLLFMHPRLIEKFINIFARRWWLKRELQINLRYSQVLMLTIFYSVLWIILGIENFLLIRSFYALEFRYLFYLISINAGSWVIGYLVVIAPGGIGVKEGVFTVAFQQIVPGSIAAISAIASRIFQIIAEIIITGIFVFFDKGARQILLDVVKQKRLPGAEQIPQNESSVLS
jgi:uncharacterized membrane protein YbhN (UPF0104 family)